MINKPLPERLRGLLEQAGMTSAQLARSAGLSRSIISRTLSGDRPASANTLNLIAPLLGTTYAELVRGTGLPKDPNAEPRVGRPQYAAMVHEAMVQRDAAERAKSEARSLLAETLQARRSASEAVEARLAAEAMVKQLEADAAISASAAADEVQRERKASERYRKAMARALGEIASHRTALERVAGLAEASRDPEMAAVLTAMAPWFRAPVRVDDYLRDDGEKPGDGG